MRPLSRGKLVSDPTPPKKQIFQSSAGRAAKGKGLVTFPSMRKKRLGWKKKVQRETRYLL